MGGPQRPWSGRKDTRTKKSGSYLKPAWTPHHRLERKPSLSTAADVAAGGGAVGGSHLEPHTRCTLDRKGAGPCANTSQWWLPQDPERVAAKTCHCNVWWLCVSSGSPCSQTLPSLSWKGLPHAKMGPWGRSDRRRHVVAWPVRTRCREGSSPAATEKDRSAGTWWSPHQESSWEKPR